jgi:hypothetical protein
MLTKLFIIPSVLIVCGLVAIVYLLVPATHTVSYYLANPAEAVRVLAVCRNAGEISANCRNAQEAKWQMDLAAVIGHRS